MRPQVQACSSVYQTWRARPQQGLTLVMAPPSPPPAATTAPTAATTAATTSTASNRGAWPPGGPSLLGQPYLAAQGPGRLVVGATKVMRLNCVLSSITHESSLEGLCNIAE